MTNEQNRIILLIKRLFGDDLSLEHVIFFFGATAGMILSAFGAISNSVLNMHYLTILIPLLNLAVDIICVIFTFITKQWKCAAVVVYSVASFMLFPFLWFSSGGMMSSNLPLIIGLGVVIMVVFKGKMRAFLFFSVLILYSGLIIFELYFPGHYIEYPSVSAKYWDILIGFSLSFLVSGGLAYFSLKRYQASKKEAEELVKKLEQISVTDPLTGIFNRRHLMTRVDEEMRRSFDSGEPLALCILDIDHFKNVNDTYGHIYGDEVLIKVTSAISHNLDENAVFGRYGGEEFVIVFTNSDLEMVRNTIDKFLKTVREIDWPKGDPITLSGGVSVYTKGLSYSKFLENADMNLYKAKNNGRDRIEY